MKRDLKSAGKDACPTWASLPTDCLRLLAALCFVASTLAAQTPAVSCDSLSALKLPDTTITSAKLTDASNDLPASCRVAATLRPSADSEIKIEVWMPATVSAWNGKFQANGNGGWSGAINPGALSAALHRGYATAATDTGHSGGSGSFALGHPEKLVDFGYRAVHEMTVKAKAIVAAYYGNGPKLSYWVGCSSGGKQGLKEAQKFPADYDGIVAGAPANYWTHLVTYSLWDGVATLKDPAANLSRDKFALIHKAVVDACDANDGVKDGVLENPTRCSFDPKVLQCTAEEQPTCLTAPQVEAARKIYGPEKNPRTGQEIFPGLDPGSEMGWGPLAGGPQPLSIATDHFKYVVFKDPNWDYKTFDFDKDVALTDKIDNGLLNATDPDISKFVGHGGKLLMYHGWTDQLIPPRNSINYYNSVVGVLGAAKAADSVRLFMAPGMNHCGGGDGPSNFDALGALEQWVEGGKAPERIVASKRSGGGAPGAAPGQVERTRPLCVYPQVAQYKGSGDTNDAANFVCAVEGNRTKP
jgi:feruloyl esterase